MVAELDMSSWHFQDFSRMQHRHSQEFFFEGERYGEGSYTDLNCMGSVGSSPSRVQCRVEPLLKTGFGAFGAWKNTSDGDKFDVFLTFLWHIWSHSQLLNVRLHVYICPCYIFKRVVKNFSLHFGGLGPLWICLWNATANLLHCFALFIILHGSVHGVTIFRSRPLF